MPCSIVEASCAVVSVPASVDTSTARPRAATMAIRGAPRTCRYRSRKTTKTTNPIKTNKRRAVVGKTKTKRKQRKRPRARKNKSETRRKQTKTTKTIAIRGALRRQQASRRLGCFVCTTRSGLLRGLPGLSGTGILLRLCSINIVAASVVDTC